MKRILVIGFMAFLVSIVPVFCGEPFEDEFESFWDNTFLRYIDEKRGKNIYEIKEIVIKYSNDIYIFADEIIKKYGEDKEKEIIKNRNFYDYEIKSFGHSDIFDMALKEISSVENSLQKKWTLFPCIKTDNALFVMPPPDGYRPDTQRELSNSLISYVPNEISLYDTQVRIFYAKDFFGLGKDESIKLDLEQLSRLIKNRIPDSMEYLKVSETSLFEEYIKNGGTFNFDKDGLLFSLFEKSVFKSEHEIESYVTYAVFDIKGVSIACVMNLKKRGDIKTINDADKSWSDLTMKSWRDAILSANE